MSILGMAVFLAFLLFGGGIVVNLFNYSSLGRHFESAVSELPCCSFGLMTLGKQ